METKSTESCSTCTGWRLPVFLVLVLAVIILLRIVGDRLSSSTAIEEEKPGAANESAGQRVSLTIDFGNGRSQNFDAVAWREGMTVADLLNAASTDLGVKQRGSGQGAFLTAIGDASNEGAGGKNWTYEINGESADRSFAVYELRPGDRVLWTFGPQR